MRFFTIPIHCLRILRAMLVLSILKQFTKPEYVELITYGRYVVHKGDVVMLDNRARVVDIGIVEGFSDFHDVIYLRVFRRPNGN